MGGRTSFKLLDQVLYLESDRERFEVSRESHTGKYRVAKVKDPYFKDNAYMSSSERQKPLIEGTTIVADSLDWSDLQWGESSLIIAPRNGNTAKIGPLKNYKYYQIAK